MQRTKPYFVEKEQHLLRQLQELRDGRNEYEASLQKQVDDVNKRSEEATRGLRTEQQKINDDIVDDEEWLQDMQQRYKPGFMSQTSPAAQPKQAQGTAASPVQPTTTAKRRPATENKTRGRQSSSQTLETRRKIKIIHADFPIVVRFKGKWSEIACFICGANISRDQESFFKGWANLRHHMPRFHPDGIDGKTDEQLLRTCIKRHFSSADVERLAQGLQPEEYQDGPIQRHMRAVGHRDAKSREKEAILENINRVESRTTKRAESPDDDDEVNNPGRRLSQPPSTQWPASTSRQDQDRFGSHSPSASKPGAYPGSQKRHMSTNGAPLRDCSSNFSGSPPFKKPRNDT